jgi:hypothetical protein
MALDDELDNKFGRARIPHDFLEHYTASRQHQEDTDDDGLGNGSGMYIIDFSDPQPETTQVYTTGKHKGEPVDAIHCCGFYDV